MPPPPRGVTASPRSLWCGGAGKYLVLFFYPLDFTFVCPTEILAFSDRAEEFRKINAYCPPSPPLFSWMEGFSSI